MADHPMISLIDQMVQDAERAGTFDNLPGAGKPLPDQPDPKDALLNRMRREAKVKPRIVVLQEDITAARKTLQGLTDIEERKDAMKTLADLELRLALEKEAMRRFG